MFVNCLKTTYLFAVPLGTKMDHQNHTVTSKIGVVIFLQAEVAQLNRPVVGRTVTQQFLVIA